MASKTYLISRYFDWYLMDVMPAVEKNAIQQKYGYHGLYTHTSAVVFRGIDYALNLGKLPKDVILACAFHDIARINDGDDFEHGINAVPLAVHAMDEISNISKQSRESILFAIKNHSLNLPAPDYVSACMWDADRTRLAWAMGYNAKFFTTDRAKVVASAPAPDYLYFMSHNISAYAAHMLPQLSREY